MGDQSRYTIDRTRAGSSSGVRTVSQRAVDLWRGRAFVVSAADGSDVYTIRGHGLYQTHKIIDDIAAVLMWHWQGHPRGVWDVARWAVRQTAKALASRLAVELKALRETAPWHVRAMQRRMFAATFGFAEVALLDEFYSDPFFVKDFLRYYAVAITTANIRENEAADNWAWDLWDEHAVPEYKTACCLAHITEMRIAARSSACTGRVARAWTRDGQLYPALNKTLDTTPLHTPRGRYPRLTALPERLPRPMTNRLELTALLLWIDAIGLGYAQGADQLQVFFRSSAEDIQRGFARWAEHMREPSLSVHRTFDLGRWVQYLADYPDPWNGTVVGLTDAAIKWHRAMRTPSGSPANRPIWRTKPPRKHHRSRCRRTSASGSWARWRTFGARAIKWGIAWRVTRRERSGVMSTCSTPPTKTTMPRWRSILMGPCSSPTVPQTFSTSPAGGRPRPSSGGGPRSRRTRPGPPGWEKYSRCKVTRRG